MVPSELANGTYQIAFRSREVGAPIVEPEEIFLPVNYGAYGPQDYRTWSQLMRERFPRLEHELTADGWRMLLSLGLSGDLLPSLDDHSRETRSTSSGSIEFEVNGVPYENEEIGEHNKPINRYHIDEPLIAVAHIPGINPVINKTTDWKFKAVGGHLPLRPFCACLLQRQFPTVVTLRSPETLHDEMVPDIFHDVVGHSVFLSDKALTDALLQLSHLVVNCKDQESLYQLERVYWHMFAHGLIRENGQLKIFGSLLVSSASRSAWALRAGLNGGPQLVPFDLDRIRQTDFDIMDTKAEFFVLDCFERLRDGLLKLHIQ